MKPILLSISTILLSFCVMAQTPKAITNRLDLMEKNIALTADERAALEPLMVKYSQDIAKLNSEKEKKQLYNQLTIKIFKVIGQRRWHQAMALEQNRRIAIPPTVQTRSAIFSKALNLDKTTAEKVEEYMALYNYDIADLNARKATQQEIAQRWKQYVNEISTLLGSQEKFTQGMQAIKKAEDAKKTKQ